MKYTIHHTPHPTLQVKLLIKHVPVSDLPATDTHPFLLGGGNLPLPQVENKKGDGEEGESAVPEGE
ncbi:hypothetical protein EON63_02580, partial [archaeon]